MKSFKGAKNVGCAMLIVAISATNLIACGNIKLTPDEMAEYYKSKSIYESMNKTLTDSDKEAYEKVLWLQYMFNVDNSTLYTDTLNEVGRYITEQLKGELTNVNIQTESSTDNSTIASTESNKSGNNSNSTQSTTASNQAGTVNQNKGYIETPEVTQPHISGPSNSNNASTESSPAKLQRYMYVNDTSSTNYNNTNNTMYYNVTSIEYSGNSVYIKITVKSTNKTYLYRLKLYSDKINSIDKFEIAK